MIKNPHFLVLGRAGMDLYPEDRAKISSGALLRPALGGSSGNIAAGLARLGHEVEILTNISDDPIGEFVKSQCTRFGIGTRYLGSAPKGTNTNLALAENRLEDFEVVIYRNGAADLSLGLAEIERVDFTEFGALIVTGTALSSEPSYSAALEAMRRAEVSVIDLDYRAAAWSNIKKASAAFGKAVDIADIIVGNDDEFSVLALGDRRVGEKLARDIGKTKTVIYKMGGAGAKTFSPEREFSTPIFAVDALKPVGAGDAFMAGLLSALSADLSLERAVEEGAANAAIVVSRPGCAPAMPTRIELDQFLKNRGK